MTNDVKIVITAPKNFALVDQGLHSTLSEAFHHATTVKAPVVYVVKQTVDSDRSKVGVVIEA